MLMYKPMDAPKISLVSAYVLIQSLENVDKFSSSTVGVSAWKKKNTRPTPIIDTYFFGTYIDFFGTTTIRHDTL